MPSVRIRFSATLFQENSSNRSPRRITNLVSNLAFFWSLFLSVPYFLTFPPFSWPWNIHGKKMGMLLIDNGTRWQPRVRLSERWKRFEPSGTVGKPWPRCFRLWLEMSSELVWTVITIDTRVCRLSFARQVSFENLRYTVITCTVFFLW